MHDPSACQETADPTQVGGVRIAKARRFLHHLHIERAPCSRSRGVVRFAAMVHVPHPPGRPHLPFPAPSGNAPDPHRRDLKGGFHV